MGKGTGSRLRPGVRACLSHSGMTCTGSHNSLHLGNDTFLISRFCFSVQVSSSTFCRWQTERKSNLPKVTQQVIVKPERASKLSVSKAAAFPQGAFGFMGYHGCFNSRLVLKVFFVVVVFLRNKAYGLQKRNTKVSFVSPHLKDLWAVFLSDRLFLSCQRR